MSETVKLIVEIPKDAYGACKALKTDNDQGILTFCVVNAVANGIPLDDVKAEIKKSILDEPVENGTNAEMACYNGGLLKCLEIIDKHIGKAESEVTPNE